jgi:hypothetical protein
MGIDLLNAPIRGAPAGSRIREANPLFLGQAAPCLLLQSLKDLCGRRFFQPF